MIEKTIYMRILYKSSLDSRVFLVVDKDSIPWSILQELIEKRCTLMKAFEEYRTKRIEEWNNQKKRRLELRCSKCNILSILQYIGQIIIIHCVKN